MVGASRSAAAITPAESTPPAAASAGPALNVLLAEDNPVNVKFALKLLERAGHKVTVANNGRQAVDLWQNTPFDIVLMDVQMPEMDGLDATREIRRLEKDRNGNGNGGARRTPIIAMTANAMAAIARCASTPAWMATSPSRSRKKRCSQKSAEYWAKELSMPRVFNDAELLERIDNDWDFLAETVEMLQTDGRGLMDEVRKSADANDAAALGRAAHTLKGMISNFCSPATHDSAFEVEKIGSPAICLRIRRHQSLSPNSTSSSPT
jgi:CheY-like chemotaxis protein